MNIDKELEWLQSIGPLATWDELDDDSADRFDKLVSNLEDFDYLTETQGKSLYFSISGMFDGLGTEIPAILSKIEGYPFEWILYDDRDESETEDFVKENKIAALELGDVFPIAPLPTYRFDKAPFRWLTEALSVDLETYELQKVFLYSLWSLGGVLAPTPQMLKNEDGKGLLISAREKVEAFTPQSDNLELEKQNILEMLDCRVADIGRLAKRPCSREHL